MFFHAVQRPDNTPIVADAGRKIKPPVTRVPATGAGPDFRSINWLRGFGGPDRIIIGYYHVDLRSSIAVPVGLPGSRDIRWPGGADVQLLHRARKHWARRRRVHGRQAWPHERALDSATRRADARRCRQAACDVPLVRVAGSRPPFHREGSIRLYALLRYPFRRSARRHDSADARPHAPRLHRVRPEVPELAQLFAFWLAVVTWRRAASNSAAHSGA